MLELEADQQLLVRCLDSCRSLGVLASHLRASFPEVERLGSGCLAPARSAGALAEMMYGFDEVWVGGRATDWDVVWRAPFMTSDGVRFGGPDEFFSESESIDDYLRPLRESGADFGMGDGCGLNVVERT